MVEGTSGAGLKSMASSWGSWGRPGAAYATARTRLQPVHRVAAAALDHALHELGKGLVLLIFRSLCGADYFADRGVIRSQMPGAA